LGICKQVQSEIVWKIRDNLQAEVSLDALRGLLEYNKQELCSGEAKVSITHTTRFVFLLNSCG